MYYITYRTHKFAACWWVADSNITFPTLTVITVWSVRWPFWPSEKLKLHNSKIITASAKQHKRPNGSTRLYCVPNCAGTKSNASNPIPRLVPTKSKSYSTQYSQVVPHPSTNYANTRLTSEIRRDPVRACVYGHNQML